MIAVPPHGGSRTQVIAGITAALAAGNCPPDAVAVEARKHVTARNQSHRANL